MKDGRSLQDLAIELERQNTAKRDFLVQSSAMSLLPGADGKMELSVEVAKGNQSQFATYGMNEIAHRQKGAGILGHLIAGGDLSLYGLANAVTRQAQDVASYDRSTELEAAGYRIITMSPALWKSMTRERV